MLNVLVEATMQVRWGARASTTVVVQDSVHTLYYTGCTVDCSGARCLTCSHNSYLYG